MRIAALVSGHRRPRERRKSLVGQSLSRPKEGLGRGVHQGPRQSVGAARTSRARGKRCVFATQRANQRATRAGVESCAPVVGKTAAAVPSVWLVQEFSLSNELLQMEWLVISDHAHHRHRKSRHPQDCTKRHGAGTGDATDGPSHFDQPRYFFPERFDGSTGCALPALTVARNMFPRSWTRQRIISNLTKQTYGIQSGTWFFEEGGCANYVPAARVPDVVGAVKRGGRRSLRVAMEETGPRGSVATTAERNSQIHRERDHCVS